MKDIMADGSALPLLPMAICLRGTYNQNLTGSKNSPISQKARAQRSLVFCFLIVTGLR